MITTTTSTVTVMQAPAMLEGIVDHINETRTLGFIRGDDGRQYFFIPSYLSPPNLHRISSVHIGDRVCFEPFQHPRGVRARAVRNLSVRE